MLQQRAQLQAPLANRGSVCSTSATLQFCSSHRHAPFLHHRRLARLWPAPHATPVEAPRLYQPSHIDGIASSNDYHSSATAHSSLWSRLNWELLLLLSAAPVPAALAEEGLRYNAERGEGIVKTLSGVAYIGLLLYFLTRVLNRRARTAREERLAGQGPVRTIFTQLIEKATEGKERRKATPLNTAVGALQAGAIAYGLFIFTTKAETLISAQNLPAGYTAANIAITVRTIIIGLLYLATFIFSANALGLTGLSIQLLLFPDSIPDEDFTPKQAKAPALPKVSVTSSPEEIKRAFEAVSKQGSNSNSSSSDGPGGDASTAAAAAAAAGTASSSSSSDGPLH